jgi:sec-independent protein translocase protein TatB
MFGLGFWELVIIAVVALMFIGPDRLPVFFRAFGRATREFQKASRELREQLSIDEELKRPGPAPAKHRPPPIPPGHQPPPKSVEATGGAAAPSGPAPAAVPAEVSSTRRAGLLDGAEPPAAGPWPWPSTGDAAPPAVVPPKAVPGAAVPPSVAATPEVSASAEPPGGGTAPALDGKTPERKA